MNRDQYVGKRKQFIHSTVRAKREDSPPRDSRGDYEDHGLWSRKQYEMLEQRAERELKDFLQHSQGWGEAGKNH